MFPSSAELVRLFPRDLRAAPNELQACWATSFLFNLFFFTRWISSGFVQWVEWIFFTLRRALFYKLSKRIGISKLWMNLSFEFLWLLHKCIIIHFHLYGCCFLYEMQNNQLLSEFQMELFIFFWGNSTSCGGNRSSVQEANLFFMSMVFGWQAPKLYKNKNTYCR